MDVKIKLYENVLYACLDEHKDKISTFNQLDAKSQQVAGFSGVLLGVLITFCKIEVLEFLKSISLWSIIFCIFAIILLMSSIALSIYSMKIIRVVGMPTYQEMSKVFSDMCTQEDFENRDYLDFISSKIELWNETFVSLSDANTKKGKYVLNSQIMCGCGLLFLSVISIIVLQSFVS